MKKIMTLLFIFIFYISVYAFPVVDKDSNTVFKAAPYSFYDVQVRNTPSEPLSNGSEKRLIIHMSERYDMNMKEVVKPAYKKIQENERAPYKSLNQNEIHRERETGR